MNSVLPHAVYAVTQNKGEKRMYCKKCGRKLTEGQSSCSNCGEPAETAEICGGFWGLINEEPPFTANPLSTSKTPNGKKLKQEDSKPDESTADVEFGDAPRHSQQKKEKNNVIPYFICVVLAFALILQTIRLSSISSQLSELNESLSSYIEQYSEVKIENDAIRSQIEIIMDDVNLIKNITILDKQSINSGTDSEHNFGEVQQNVSDDVLTEPKTDVATGDASFDFGASSANKQFQDSESAENLN